MLLFKLCKPNEKGSHGNQIKHWYIVKSVSNIIKRDLGDWNKATYLGVWGQEYKI